jgi:uncharacterized protein YdhG (YjbR/CyaY superfamily)
MNIDKELSKHFTKKEIEKHNQDTKAAFKELNKRIKYAGETFFVYVFFNGIVPGLAIYIIITLLLHH